MTKYRLEHWRTTLGMWAPLTESTIRTGFRLTAVEYASWDAAQAALREHLAVGWTADRLRIGEATTEDAR